MGHTLIYMLLVEEKIEFILVLQKYSSQRAVDMTSAFVLYKVYDKYQIMEIRLNLFFSLKNL